MKIFNKVLGMFTILALVLSTSVPLVYAAQSYNVSITTPVVINGMTLTISGLTNGEYVGQQSDQFVRITNWGDGSAVTQASTVFSFGPGKLFSGTWSASHTYSSSGTYSVTAEICHQTCSGAEGGDTAIDTEVIVIPPPNGAPVATADVYSISEDSVMLTSAPGVLSNDTDADSNPLTAVLVTPTTNGTLTFNVNGSFTYTPTANFNGTDSFTYKANDGTADSNMVTVTITITPENDAPVALNDSDSTNEDTPLTTVYVLTNDTDIDGDSLSISGTYSTSVSGGTVVDNGNGTFNYTPALNFNGSDSFNYTVTDGSLTDVGTVTITVSNTNDAPVAAVDSYTTDEDVVLVETSVLGNDTDTEANTLTAVLVTTTTNGSLTLNTDGTFTYTPNANFNGTDSFVYHANDGTANSSDVTVTITVNPVNDAPVATADTYSTNEDTVLTVPVNGVLVNDTDTEISALTAIVVTPTTNGSLTVNADGSFDYTPNANFNGSDSFTYKANDGTADSNTVTVSITITAVNDAPTITLNPPAEAVIQFNGTFTDPVCTDVDNEGLTAVKTGSIDNEEAGVYTLTYTCNDGQLSASTTRTVTVQEEPAACMDENDNDGDNKTDYPADPGCTSPTDNDETDPVVVVDVCPNIGGTQESVPQGKVLVNGQCVDAGGGGGSVVLIPSTPAPAPVGQVLGATTSCEPYLTDFLKKGTKNNKDQVKKLQTFLNDYLKLSPALPVNGIFGPQTFKAVVKFQQQETDLVLKPWVGITLKDSKKGTGWVFKTTKTRINNIMCPDLNLAIPPLTLN